MENTEGTKLCLTEGFIHNPVHYPASGVKSNILSKEGLTGTKSKHSSLNQVPTDDGETEKSLAMNTHRYPRTRNSFYKFILLENMLAGINNINQLAISIWQAHI